MVEYTTITVTKETKEAIDRLAKSTGKSKTQIFSDVFETIDGLLASMEPCEKCKIIGFTVIEEFLANRVILKFTGRNLVLTNRVYVPNDATPEQELEAVKANAEEIMSKKYEEANNKLPKEVVEEIIQEQKGKVKKIE